MSQGNEQSDINEILQSRHSPKTRLMILAAAGFAVAVIIGAGWMAWVSSQAKTTVRYETVEAERGDLVIKVSATGTLEPVNTVDVGSEMSGTVKTVEVDFNDTVVEGQVLTRLDTTKLEAQKVQYQANVEAARAELLNAQTDVLEAKASLDRLRNAFEATEGKYPSRQDLETAEINYKKTQTLVEVAKANVSKAEAVLEANESDISKATIRSPINGMVLDRQVDPGQTVAASLSAPVLFTLAENLTSMTLYVSVDEADVGQMKEGQSGVFLVDAYPDREFPARITQVRYASETESGVVTYKCLLAVDNSDLTLRPGMTATADIIVEEVRGAVVAPNAALRFTPAAPTAPAAQDKDFVSKLLPSPPRRTQGQRSTEEAGAGAVSRVWVLKDGHPEPVVVSTGSTDGVKTVILSDNIEPGQKLVINEIQGKK